MYKDVAVIIPALDKNRYSENGDLVKFGDLSLLEWKLIQINNFVDPKNVFISTPSLEIEKIGKAYNMNIVKRPSDLNMIDVIINCVKGVKQDIILWTHATSPFVSSVDFCAMIDMYKKRKKIYDSLVSVFRLSEYVFFKNNALNFEMTHLIERQLIEPVYRITNGCFIAGKEIYLKYSNYFGIKPFLYEIDTLASMEIKEMGDLAIANDLISLFFKRELKV